MKINETTSVAFSKEQMFGGGASWSQLNYQSNSEHLSQLCFITQWSDCVTKYDCSFLRLPTVSLSSGHFRNEDDNVNKLRWHEEKALRSMLILIYLHQCRQTE